MSLESVRRTAVVGLSVSRRGREGGSYDRQKVPVLTNFAQGIERRGNQEYHIYVSRVHKWKFRPSSPFRSPIRLIARTVQESPIAT